MKRRKGLFTFVPIFHRIIVFQANKIELREELFDQMQLDKNGTAFNGKEAFKPFCRTVSLDSCSALFSLIRASRARRQNVTTEWKVSQPRL